MRIRCIGLAILVLLGSCLSPPLSEPQPSAVKLVWSEEFDYTGLPDPEIWTFETLGNDWGWGNGEDQFYTDRRAENAWVDNGVCTITALHEQYADGFEYTSARIITAEKADWLYGRFEVRARLPEGQGIWPAIWMMPTYDHYGGWPDSGEIDIMEYFGFMPDTVSAAVHTEKYNHKIGTSKGSRIVREGIHDEFHIYALEWFPDRLDFYFDDELYFTYKKESEDSDVWPYDQAFHMRLNCAVGGDWMRSNGGIDDSLFPHRFVIDYVRVYEFVYPGHHSLELQPAAGGTIIKEDSRDMFAPGEDVLLKALPDPGYRFISWTGDVQGSKAETTVCMGRDKVVGAVFRNENDLIRNGSFSRNSEGWGFWQDESAAHAEHGAANGEYAVQVKRTGAHDWQIQLNQHLSLKGESRYILTFRAKGDTERPLKAALLRAYAPYSGIWNTQVQIGRTWKQFSFDIYLETGDPDSRLEFDMGQTEGTVYLDDISLLFLE